MTILALLVFSFAAGQDRLPVPGEKDRKEAQKLIRSAFAEEFDRKGRVDRKDLARKLLQEAAKGDESPATRFVLLRESFDAARDSGDWDTATRALEATGKTFATDVLALKLSLHAAMATAARTPEEFLAVARRQADLADEAMIADQLETASKAAADASALAKKCKDIPLTMRADAKGREVAERKEAAVRLSAAAETLKKKPDDADANLLIGRHQALVKGSWEAALPCLARSSDAALQAAARKDLASPQDAAGRIAAGDGWWDLAEKETHPPARLNLRLRALHWYDQVEGSATSPVRDRIAQRIAEIRLDRFPGTWMDLTDPRLFDVNGKSGDPIVVAASKNQAVRLDLKRITADFDVVTVRIRFGAEDNLTAVVWLDKVARGVQLVRETLLVSVFHVEEPRKIVKENTVSFPAHPEYHLTIVLADGEYTAFLDGVEVGKVRTHLTRILELGLQAEQGTVTYDRLRFRVKKK